MAELRERSQHAAQVMSRSGVDLSAAANRLPDDTGPEDAMGGGPEERGGETHPPLELGVTGNRRELRDATVGLDEGCDCRLQGQDSLTPDVRDIGWGRLQTLQGVVKRWRAGLSRSRMM